MATACAWSPSAVWRAASRHQESGGLCSRELCGGTHVGAHRRGRLLPRHRGGQRGGRRAAPRSTHRPCRGGLALAQTSLLADVAARLGVQPAALPERVDRLLAQVKELLDERAALRAQTMQSALDGIVAAVEQIHGVPRVVRRVEAADVAGLRELAAGVRERLGSGIVALGAVLEGKPQIVVMVTDDLVAQGYDARELAGAAAREVGGGSGGRATLAQAGGPRTGKLDDALDRVGRLLAGQQPAAAPR